MEWGGGYIDNYNGQQNSIKMRHIHNNPTSNTSFCKIKPDKNAVSGLEVFCIL